jgi:chromosomal replication initiation ATPase DnaA
MRLSLSGISTEIHWKQDWWITCKSINGALIKYTVCKAYNIKETELYVTMRGYFNEPRNVAVYLIRHLRNDTLKQVGEQFGIEKYSTVSSIVERVKYEMKVDKSFKTTDTRFS